MASKSFNQGFDFFDLETATSNALKVTSSAENKSGQTTTGPNTEGDLAVVDAYGETVNNPSHNGRMSSDIIAVVDSN